jgi:hypothetical protein
VLLFAPVRRRRFEQVGEGQRKTERVGLEEDAPLCMDRRRIGKAGHLLMGDVKVSSLIRD